jgi:hypothetical protein
MTKILKTEIKSCRDCPNKESTNFWSSDGWDRMEDWECKLLPGDGEKNKNKKISGAVEWHEENKIPIPDWCPLDDKKDPEWKDYDNPVRGDMDPQSWGDDIPEPRREMGG